jgi:uncharacterized protein YdaU (DUF1376 family)
MAKDPAVLWYPGDYIGGTMGMTFEEKGAYVELLMLQFLRGHMTSHMIGQTLGQTGGQIWDRIKDKFQQDPEGLYYNERMELEIKRRQSYVKSRGNNLSGKNQYSKRGDKISAHMDGHMTSHMENENEIEDFKDIEEKGVQGEKKKKFMNIPPTIIEVQERIKERGITNFTAEVFHAHYTSKGWMIGKNPMKNWDAALTTWQANSNSNSKPVNGNKPKTRLQMIYEQNHKEDDY